MWSKYVGALLLGACSLASASESVSGTFTTSKACDAFTSFSKRKNPDGRQVAAGTAYALLEVNRRERFDWVRVAVADKAGQVQPRWVFASCGTVSGVKFTSGGASASKPPVENPCQTPNKHDGFTLAATWLPGFCGYKAGANADSLAECVALANGDIKATHLTLRGLWPVKKQCGPSYGWCGTPATQLKPETVDALLPWMPALQQGSSAAAYEWKKRGSCQTALGADDYFLKGAAAVQALNGSKLGALVLKSVGKTVSKADLVAAVNADVPNAGNSVAFLCKSNSLYEIRVSLPVEFKTDAGLSGLVGGKPQPVRHLLDVCPDQGIFIAVAAGQ